MSEKDQLTLKEALNLAKSLIPMSSIDCGVYESTREELIYALFDYAHHIQKEYDERISKTLLPKQPLTEAQRKSRLAQIEEIRRSLK